jgi:hypothetical protein
MALSRIWAAFIVVAFLAASFQCIFIKGNTDIYSRMVVGKSGDTSNTKPLDTTAISASLLSTLQSGKTFTDGTTKYSKTAAGAYISYREQHADGVIATAKPPWIFPSI